MAATVLNTLVHFVFMRVAIGVRAILIVADAVSVVMTALLVLHSYVRQTPLVLATGNENEGWSSLPAVKSLMGMALREVLDIFMSACLGHFQQNKQLQEEYYITALLQKAGQTSSIGLTLTTVVTDEVVRNKAPLTHFCRLAAHNRAEWLRTQAPTQDTKITQYMRGLIDEVEVTFEPSTEITQSLEYWQGIIDNKHLYMVPDYEQALQSVADIKSSLGTPENDYYSMGVIDKITWLRRTPRYREIADEILLKMSIFKETNPERVSNAAPAFDTIQFQTVADMKALRELSNYLIKRVGAITAAHAQVWRRRRMSLNETPMEAFAKVRGEAYCLADAGLFSFDPERELYELVSNKDLVGGPFFGNKLFDRARDLVNQ